VTEVPETRYARSVDATNLAYQVSGEGLLDLVVLGAGPFPIDLLWDDPGFIRVSERLGRFSRVVWFQPRGTGASEGDFRLGFVGKLAASDVSAVLDTVGADRVALVGWNAGGAAAISFAARRPDRVSALVLVDTWAHYVREDDYPWGVPRESLDRVLAVFRQGWGSGALLDTLAPGRMGEGRLRGVVGRAQRLGFGPDEMADAVRTSLIMDVRPVLSAVSVSTLVLHREGDKMIQLGAGRYLAEHIAGAKFVVLPGDEHLFFVGDTDALADEIEEFLTGNRSGVGGDVVTATILFTDIVSSTEHQARVGPRAWSRLTDQHDAIVRAALAHHRGREVKTTGDGFLATFDATGRSLRCAAEVLAGARGIGIELRAGVHTGEVEIRGDDIGGLAVNIAKRVCDLAGPGELLVSETVRSVMAGSGVEFEERGEHELKGVPGVWRLFAVGS
jgi:class 3 adenylate cyclase